MKKYILFLIFILSGTILEAQVAFQFIPEIQGRTVEGLFGCRILNTSGSTQTVSLSITVSEKSKGKILSVNTGSFSLMPGSNIIPAGAASGARISFSDRPEAVMIRQNGSFPEGEYEYCYALNPAAVASSGLAGEQCYNYDLLPLSPLLLVSPYDKEEICEKRPILTWQPSLPYVPGSFYQVVLTEIKENQNGAEALRYNLPLVSQDGITAPVLPYPAISRELEKGHRYAWQVSTYKGTSVLNRSEVWEFTQKCQDSLEAPVTTDRGYRDIEDLLKGNYYVANGWVRFAFVNSYETQKLNYHIRCLTDPSEKIRKLPEVKLDRGNNKININLAKTNSFKDGYSYLLELKLPGSNQKNLRFLYKETDDQTF